MGTHYLIPEISIVSLYLLPSIFQKQQMPVFQKIYPRYIAFDVIRDDKKADDG